MFRGCTSDYPAASEAISGVLNLLLRRRMLGGSRCRVVIWGKNGNKRSGWFEMDIYVYIIYVYIYIEVQFFSSDLQICENNREFVV